MLYVVILLIVIHDVLVVPLGPVSLKLYFLALPAFYYFSQNHFKTNILLVFYGLLVTYAVLLMPFSEAGERSIFFILNILLNASILTLPKKKLPDKFVISLLLFVVVSCLVMDYLGFKATSGRYVFNTYHLKFYGAFHDRGVIRYTGIFTDPNILILALTIFPVLGVYLKQGWRRLFLGLMALLVFLSFSRMGYLVALIFVFINYYHKLSFWSLLGLAGISVILIFPQLLENLVILNRFSRLTEDGGSGRLELVIKSLEAFAEQPMGWGLGSYKVIMSEYFGVFKYAHNTFAEILVELGVLGLCVYCSYWVIKVSLALSIKDQRAKRVFLAVLVCQFMILLSLSLLLSPIIALTDYLILNYLKNEHSGGSDNNL